MIEALANVEAAIDITQLCSLHIPLESHLQIDLHARAMLVADPKQVCSMGFSYFAIRSG